MFNSLSLISLPEFLAILCSLTYSVTLISLRKGLTSGSPLTPTLMVCAFNSTVGILASLFRGSLQTSTLTPILWFAMAGAIGQGVGNLVSFIGIERLGVSRSISISSSAPIWSVLFAAIFLNENPSWIVWTGTILIVGGIVLLSDTKEEVVNQSWMRGAIIYPLVASFLYGVMPIMLKIAFSYQKTPMVAMAVGFAAAGVFLILSRRYLPGGGIIAADGWAWRWFTLAAFFNMVASILLWVALAIGNVSTVIPLSRLVPLWVVLWTFLFLRDVEQINVKVVTAAALVVLGGILITSYK